MPAAASAFLLTLATVDDLGLVPSFDRFTAQHDPPLRGSHLAFNLVESLFAGAIVVLAVFYASNVVMPYIAASAAVTAGLAAIGNKKMASLPAFAIGGAILWLCASQTTSNPFAAVPLRDLLALEQLPSFGGCQLGHRWRHHRHVRVHPSGKTQCGRQE